MEGVISFFYAFMKMVPLFTRKTALRPHARVDDMGRRGTARA